MVSTDCSIWVVEPHIRPRGVQSPGAEIPVVPRPKAATPGDGDAEDVAATGLDVLKDPDPDITARIVKDDLIAAEPAGSGGKRRERVDERKARPTRSAPTGKPIACDEDVVSLRRRRRLAYAGCQRARGHVVKLAVLD